MSELSEAELVIETTASAEPTLHLDRQCKLPLTLVVANVSGKEQNDGSSPARGPRRASRGPDGRGAACARRAPAPRHPAARGSFRARRGGDRRLFRRNQERR